MISYVFPLTKILTSPVFFGALSEINHAPFLTHTGEEPLTLSDGLKPDSTVYLDGSSESDPYNLYVWYNSEKTPEELSVISSKIVETIENNEPEFPQEMEENTDPPV